MLEASPAVGGDLATALDRLVVAAQEGARLQARVAGAARAAASEERARRRTEVSSARIREVLDLVSASSDRLVGAAAELRRAWATSLAAQGLSRRQIAARLGVSHQRVSALLGREASPTALAPP